MDSLLSADDGKTNMLKLTSKHLCRMYPGGHRVDSSNYDPQEAWSAGTQLVALNVQVGGITRSTLLALALLTPLSSGISFTGCGQEPVDQPGTLSRQRRLWVSGSPDKQHSLSPAFCSPTYSAPPILCCSLAHLYARSTTILRRYILKPEYMRGLHEEAAAAATPKPSLMPVVLSITMASSDGWTGGWGMVGLPDLYCTAEICGHKKDRSENPYTTKMCKQSKSPAWDEEAHFTITEPQEAILLLQVWEHDTFSADDFMGQGEPEYLGTRRFAAALTPVTPDF